MVRPEIRISDRYSIGGTRQKRVREIEQRSSHKHRRRVSRSDIWCSEKAIEKQICEEQKGWNEYEEAG